MATVETTFSEIIPQQLMPGSRFTAQKKSPVLARVNPSSRNVTRIGVGTSGWRWERSLGLGLGGVVRFVNSQGPATVSGASPMVVMSEAQTYPAPLEAVQPGYDTMVGTLSKIRGNIVLDEVILQETQLAPIITDHYNNLINGVTLRLTLQKLSKLFTPSSTFRHICSVSSWATTDSNNGSFIPAEGNEVLFHEGMMVQFYDNPSASLVSHRHTSNGLDDASVRIMVMAVDPTTRTVYVKDIDGTGKLALSGNAVADGDLVVNQGELTGGGAVGVGGTASAYGSFGFVDWLINSGTVLGIDTDVFQRIKSFITSNLAAPWTEDEADKILMFYDRWHDKPVTTLFMTPGVLLAHKKTMLGLFRADRTAKPVTIVGGHAGISHMHNGREIEYLPDPAMRSGHIIGQYVGEGNIEELMPPMDPSSVAGGGGMPNGVHFPGWAESNYRSIFRMVGATQGGAGTVVGTTLREAPFHMEYQWWPMMHMPGISVLGVTEVNWA